MAKAKQIAGIDCEMTAAEGIRLVLAVRMDEMCALHKSALDWSDPEGIHDMRVASRRLRGALRDFMPYVRKRRLTSSLQQIRGIAELLGRVRDLDVEIMALERAAQKAPAEISGGILSFTNCRREALEEVRVKLMTALDPDQISRLKSEFAEAIKSAVVPPQTKKSAKKGAPSPSVTYREIGRSVILSRLEELEKLSNSLYQPLRVGPLHEMRLAAKHLRYALELFEQCWGDRVAFFARKVAGLQSSLGDLHDCDVWIERLARTANHQAQNLDFDFKSTRVWLISHFVRMRAKDIARALKQWSEWETDDLSARIRSTLVEKLQ